MQLSWYDEERKVKERRATQATVAELERRRNEDEERKSEEKTGGTGWSLRQTSTKLPIFGFVSQELLQRSLRMVSYAEWATQGGLLRGIWC